MLRGKAVVMSQFGALPAYCRPAYMQCAATRGDMTAEPALGTLFWPRASVKPAVETQETQRGPTKEAMCRRRQGGGWDPGFKSRSSKTKDPS